MTAAGRRVLVMDDEDVVCRSYERVLTQAGFEVGKAHSGSEALEEVATRDYDVMLADLKMPGMDGLQVVEKLRGTHPEMPVVVITGFPSQETLRDAARLGVADYLTKPITPEVLKAATLQALTGQWTRSPAVVDKPEVAKVAEATAIPLAPKLTNAPLLVQKRPVEVPTPPVVHQQVAEVAEAAELAAPESEDEPGGMHVAMQLVLAPVISLAYVLFLPFLGFAVFLGLGAKALYRKFGG